MNDDATHGLCASSRCKFVILALGLALVAAPIPMGYASHSTAMNASIAAGLAIWICALVSMVASRRLTMLACAACGVLAAAAPRLAGFGGAEDAAFVHGAIGGAVALVALGGLAMSSNRASVPIRI